MANKILNLVSYTEIIDRKIKSDLFFFFKIFLMTFLFLLQISLGETSEKLNYKGDESFDNYISNNNDNLNFNSDYENLFNYNYKISENRDFNNNVEFKSNNNDEFTNYVKRDIVHNNVTINFEKTDDVIVDLNSKSHRFIERGENIEYGMFNETDSETESNKFETENDTTEKVETTPLFLIPNTTTNQELKIVTTVELEQSTNFSTSFDSNTTDDPFGNGTDLCIGPRDYCNLTLEEYMVLLQDYIFPEAYEWVLIVCHGLVFFVGLIGNALVCVAVYRNHSMRTVTNYFIVNLAVADFMVILFCLPPTVIWDVTETWIFGNTMCRIIPYFQSVSVTVSVLTLTFISVDRWYAICFPLKFKSTTGRAKTAIFVIWLLSLLFNLPEFVVLQTVKSNIVRFDLDYFTQCAATWSRDKDLTWHIIKAVFLYTLPLLLMTIAYCQIVKVLWKSNNIPGHCESQNYNNSASPPSWASNNRRTTTMSAHVNASTEAQVRTRRKAAKMLVAVVVMFAVCYFPVHLYCVLRLASNLEQSSFMSFLALVSHWLCYANSAVNPLIYNFMSGKFRQEFRRSFFECRCLGLGPSRTPGSAQNNMYGRGAMSRAGTRRSESCASYRLAHLSNCDRNDRDRSRLRTHTTFIENNNSRKQIRSDSVSDNPATKLTLDMESRQ